MRFAVLLIVLLVSAFPCRLELAIADEGVVDKILESVEARRKLAAKDREALLANREILQKELERVRELRNWGGRDFDDQLSVQTRYKNASPEVTRWRGLRSKVMSHLLNLPVEANAARIWTGSGLNALQDCLGPVAMQHELFLRQIELLPESSRTSEQDARIALIEELTRGLELPKSALNGVQCQQGLKGQLLQVKLIFGETVEMQIFPLDWPAWFRTRPDMKEFMDRIAEARADCIKAAGQNNYEPAQRLMKAIDDLDRKFAELHRRHFQMLIAGVPREIESKVTTENREIQLAKTFMKTLRCSTARFIEMDSFPQAEQFLVEKAQSHGTSDQISLITVLAAMQERGLRFGPATRSAEASHQVLFEKMRSYYAALYSLSLAVEEQKRKIAMIDKQISENHETERRHLALMGKLIANSHDTDTFLSRVAVGITMLKDGLEIIKLLKDK